MNITLIRPSAIHREIAFSHTPTPPLGLAYVAAVLLREGHDVQVIDAAVEGFFDVEPFKFGTHIFGLNIENTIARIRPDVDVIGFSFMFTNSWPLDRELVAEARARFPHATIVAGGEHVTSVPDYSFNTAPGLDYIVMGEGEGTLVELLRSLQNGDPLDTIDRIAYRQNGQTVINNQNRKIKRIQNLDEIPWPAWELFPIDDYFEHKVTYGVYRGRSLPLLVSRGCPYECTFCSSPQMWGRKYNLRSVKDVVDEMEVYHQKYRVTNFDFFDLTAIIQKKWILDLCHEIINRKLDITYQIPAGTRAEAIDYEVSQMLYKSGCKNITYAPESGSARVLKDIKKKVSLDHICQSIKYSHKAGMNIKLNIIVGFLEETHADVWRTIWFLVKSSWYGAHDMYPAVFSPYPGSELFEQLSKEGKVDIYDDDYMMQIINSHDLWPGKTYSNVLGSNTIKTYTLVMYMAFYGSNFLFRPQRVFRLVRNLITKRHESRAELVLSQTISKFKGSKKVGKPVPEMGKTAA